MRHAIGATTIRRILKSNGIEPARARSKKTTWNEFIRQHWDSLAAYNFFTVEIWTSFGLVRYVVFYHVVRNHQGIGNKLIENSEDRPVNPGSVLLRTRLGGMLKYDYRPAARRSYPACLAIAPAQSTVPP